jgi:hypothetical protein
MNRSAKAPHSVIAIMRDETEYRAVQVQRQDGIVRVLWSRSEAAETQTWSEFAAACGLTTPAGQTHKIHREPAVAGLDSTAVAFYRISAPAVGAEETSALVRMQAESLLPLSPDRIEVAWRKMPSTNGQVDITIAAARREHLVDFAHRVRPFQPRHVFLSCEGLAKAWQSLFAAQERRAVVVSVGRRLTQVCLVEDGLLTHSTVVDTGMVDLAPPPSGPAESAQTAERFAQDMRAVLASFGWKASMPGPVVVMSDGSAAFDHIVASLNAAGLPAKISLPRTEKVAGPTRVTPEAVYKYRVPLGLALMALEGTDESLDLFAQMARDEQARATRSSRWTTWAAGAAAAALLAGLVTTAYFVDRAKAAHFDALLNRSEFKAAQQHQKLLKTVARHRPDILQLLTDLGAGETDGIILDSMNFKKGQPVTITGQADNEEKMWKFQDGLRNQKGVSDVDNPSASPDKKTKKLKFTITFQYKSFTKKDAVL